MRKIGILPQLNKKYILERITQEEIMEFYTGVPVNGTTCSGNSFTSPIRDDNNPTCNYWYSISESTGEERLKLKDWDGSFNGDIFDVASHFTRINIKSGQGFKLLMNKIASDFKIHRFADKTERERLAVFIDEYHKRAELKPFKVIPRAWNRFDYKYWFERYGITEELLRQGYVIPVQQLEIVGKDGYFHISYKYYSTDPAYAYYGGEVDGIKLWKIYLPLRKKGQKKWFQNYAFMQGEHLFKPARIGIISKGYKDTLCYHTFGIQSKAIPNENYLMTKDEIFSMKSDCDIVLTNFDYDRAGILLANKYRKVHGVLPLMFTKGRFNQPDYGVKDFSDFRDTYGRDKTFGLINSVIDTYRDDLNTIVEYNYNSLKWIQ